MLLETNQSKWLGNYFGFKGHSFDGAVYDKKYISPTLLSCMANGNVPKIIVGNQDADIHSEQKILNRV